MTLLISFNSEITSDKAALVVFYFWRRLLGDFHPSSRKAKKVIAALLGTLALHRYGRGELVSSREFVNLISHRKKIKELPLTLYSL